MNQLEKLSSIADKLQLSLVRNNYSHGCNCRNCDALTEVHAAREAVKELITHLVSSAIPSTAREAQERSKAVAEGEGALAVACEVSPGRFDLWRDGVRVMTGYAADLLCYSRGTGTKIYVL